MKRTWTALLVVALLAPMGATSIARADSPTIPTINIGPAGPDQELPTQGSFYLKGTAPAGIERVYPVFVRVSYKPFAYGSKVSCKDVANGLRPEQVLWKDPLGGGVGGLKVPVFDQHAAVLKASQVWEAPKLPERRADYDEVKDDPVYFPKGWERPRSDDPAQKTKEATYNVLVAEPGFFRPGASYCLLVYQMRRTEKDDKKLLSKAIFEYERTRAKCDQRPTDDEKRTCKQERDNALIEDIKKITARPDIQVSDILEQTVRDKVVDAVAKIAGFEADIKAALGAAPKPPFLDKPWEAPKAPLPADASPFARALLLALYLKGDIARSVYPPAKEGENVGGKRVTCKGPDRSPACDGRVEYSTRGGKTVIKALRLLPDASAVDLWANRDGNGDRGERIAVNATTLMMGDGLSLRAVLDLGRGHATIDKEDMVLGGLVRGLVPTLLDAQKASLDGGAPIDAKKVTSLADTLDALKTMTKRGCDELSALRLQIEDKRRLAKEQLAKAPPARDKRAPKAPAAAPPPPPSLPPPAGLPLPISDAELIAESEDLTTSRSQASLLGAFLEQSVLGSCSDSHLEKMATAAKSYESGVVAWNEALSVLTAKVTELSIESPLTAPIAAVARIDQKAFFDLFVTPFLGRAQVIHPGTDFALTYLGIHINPFPNDVVEPMWINRNEDWRRFVALELGVAVEPSGYGDKGRYSGPGVFPPLLAGVALNVLPYVTVSSGFVWMESRRSVLSTERAVFTPAFYLGLTADLNVVGAVRNLFVGRSYATVALEKKP